MQRINNAMKITIKLNDMSSRIIQTFVAALVEIANVDLTIEEAAARYLTVSS